MALVSLYVPDNVPKGFLNYAADFIKIVPTLEDSYVLFGRTESCACKTRDCLAIRGRSILVTKNHHSAVGFPLYALPNDCTFEETFVIVTWLLRYRLKTYQSGLSQKDRKFYRTLNSGSVLFKLVGETSCCCDTYTLEKDPIFMLKPILFSPYGRGPVIENVIQQTKSDG